MEIKKTDFITVLSAERKITISAIAAVSTEVCSALMRDAEQHGLMVSGPWIFVFHDLPRDRDVVFRMEFCLPVSAGNAYQGRYALRALEPILCASRHHQGPLQNLFSEGYEPLLQGVNTAGYALSGESREIYHRWQGPDAADNHIEVQFGLR